MDTRNWFGEHASAIKLIALAGGIALAAIILLDMLTHKKNGTTTGAAPATGADTSPATSGQSSTSTLQNPGETYISILEDYSSHVNNETAPVATTLPPVAALPGPIPGPILSNPLSNRPTIAETPALHAGPTPPALPVSHPASTGGATVPIPTPHPAEQYTVKSGDTLWGIAQRFLGNGADWQELYTWNRATVGGNPNLIYPGETLTIN